jgi:hypothetical protein
LHCLTREWKFVHEMGHQKWYVRCGKRYTLSVVHPFTHRWMVLRCT